MPSGMSGEARSTERNAGATQQRLLAAALVLYAERGYAGTCLDAILSQASSSKGAFYHHFSSKEALTVKALEHYWQDVLGQIEHCRADTGNPHQALARLLAWLESGETTTPSTPASQAKCPLGLLGFESPALPAPVQQSLAEGLQRWNERLGNLLIEAGVPNGEAPAVAEQLFLLYEGGVLVERISGSSSALKTALRSWQQAVNHLLDKPVSHADSYQLSAVSKRLMADC